MNIPEKAIICTPTLGDADQLDQFLREYTNRWVPLDDWQMRGEFTCWDLCEESTDHRLESMFRTTYEDAIAAFDDGDESYGRYVPDDPALRFISVSDFIALCFANEQTDCDDADFDMEELL